MYIKRLELLNFQVIEQFSADFDGTVYFVTGDNAAHSIPSDVFGAVSWETGVARIAAAN